MVMASSYSYTTSQISKLDAEQANIPDCCQFLLQRALERGLIDRAPDQLIVNEYEPGQGIIPHVDRTHCFGDTILGVSLLSDCVIRFRHVKTLEKRYIHLKPRSVMVMQRESRYEWSHGINPVLSDMIEGKKVERQRRISLTFRNVIASSDMC
jgi:alkylated DNA repair dioxygenase AlkB